VIGHSPIGARPLRTSVDRLLEALPPAACASHPSQELGAADGDDDDRHEPPQDEEAAHAPILRAPSMRPVAGADNARGPAVAESRGTGVADEPERAYPPTRRAGAGRGSSVTRVRGRHPDG
jgi:hypothetical protein